MAYARTFRLTVQPQIFQQFLLPIRDTPAYFQSHSHHRRPVTQLPIFNPQVDIVGPEFGQNNQ